jgi:hypothetical protein
VTMQIYFAADADSRFKIGVSRNVAERVAGLQTASGGKLELIGAIDGDFPLEKSLHRRFARWHLRGEWFSATREALEEIGCVIASPPKPKGILRGKRRVTDPDALIICERVGQFLRARHPRNTAQAASQETGIKAATIAKWLEGASVPSTELFLHLVQIYGPEFVSLAVVPNPGWLRQAINAEKRRAIEAEIEALKRQVSAIDAASGQGEP